MKSNRNSTSSRAGDEWIISDTVYGLCTSKDSVSSLVAADPELSPGEAWKKLCASAKKGTVDGEKPESSQSRDDRAAACGKWGPTEPGELFLTIYRDALRPLDEDVSTAVVSPSLMGSCGVVPLTVISTIPDICRHMSNLIVRAEKEVFLATNYWAASVATSFITNAMRELSRRAGERGERIVMKIIYDRGSIRQVVEPHYLVSVKEYTGKEVQIPAPDEIPNIDLQVMNYHQAALGTFHSKFMVVDRRIALLQSNNLQDNDNLEMMCHLEGPIVDSMYDTCLISWHKKFGTILPSLNAPAARGGIDSSGKTDGTSGKMVDGLFVPDGPVRGHKPPPDRIRNGPASSPNAQVLTPGETNLEPQDEPNVPDTHRADAVTGPSTTESTTHPLNSNTAANNTEPGASHPPITAPGLDEQSKAFLNTGDQALPPAQIANPPQLAEHTPDDPHYDVDIAGEVARVQAAVSPKPGETRLEAVTRHLNHTVNAGFAGDVPQANESVPHQEMTPYIPHPTHAPFPMALVNRPPHGAPTHHSVRVPQNEAWLSAMRNAKRSVFIQSPTLNAAPLVPAIIEACERGLDVFCYICLGYNDAGELLPGQGGHNEMIANKLYTSLSAEGRSHLHYFWYVAKDQSKPIPQKRKKRDCHIKLLIADERVGIMGAGNQDTQSWYHSQEVNVMLDSEEVCRAWIDGLRRNQNTHLYGALDKETGVWRDADGKEAEGATGVDIGHFSWAKGLVGAVKRVQGKGGFG